MISSIRRWPAICSAMALSMFLVACDSQEERAERHYQSAIKLLEDGDFERALVEFRNVFELDPRHPDARLVLASYYEEAGRRRLAFRHFQAAAEIDPEHAETRIKLAELSVFLGIQDALERHGNKAIELLPDDPRVQVIAGVLDYQEALRDENDAARRDAAAEILKASGQVEDSTVADQVQVDNLIRNGEYRKALDLLDGLIESFPDKPNYHTLRLRILGTLQDDDGVTQQLETMVERFPDSTEYATAYIQWLTSRGNLTEAENFIRSRIPQEGDRKEQSAVLIAYINRTRGPAAALEEVDTLLRAEEDPSTIQLFRSLRAGLQYDLGDRDAAIAEMEDLLKDADETAQTHGIKVALARMLLSQGNEVAARQQVEEVLAQDSRQVDAIKLRASWLIEADDADEAIILIRTALDQAPEDAQLMSLMAQAYLRNGDRGLAGEMLALAVETSNSAPAQALDYARFLLADEEYPTAESILINSLRVAPDNLEVLALLGRVYLASQDWARLEQVEGTLKRLDTDQSRNIAESLRVGRLRGQDKGAEALQVLESMAQSGAGGNAAIAALVRSRIADGDIAGAEAYVLEHLGKAPDNMALLMLHAGIMQADDRIDEAEGIYRDILAQNDQLEGVWRALFRSRSRQGDDAGATAVLDDALTAIPDAANLLWDRAALLERNGDVEGAISIYEDLYERFPNAPIIANNLASLISTYRTDEESLERAYAVARRLRGSELAAFQDTYGWIAFRRGENEEALEHLEPAAAGLVRDPLVQYHFGKALAAAERYDEALNQYRKAVDIAGPADTRPQLQDAKAEIARIEAILSEPADQ